ncbi:RHS repeat-associated core domain-containing protein [Streptomyces sp. NPDC002668]|uniref:RHS repeat-associated core domain-containing protein n=1 Tax=Streptomyces sp. NPDC002668 TaxID=3154422 RepID=UPI0033227620
MPRLRRRRRPTRFRARNYDATTGRLTSTDPATPSVTSPYVSAYAYVGNTPTRYTDPTSTNENK